MKKINYLLKSLVLFVCLIISGCYTDTYDSFSTMSFQIPIHFISRNYYKTAPDTSLDFANLNKYEQYNDNKSLINQLEVLQFSFWVDTLVLYLSDIDSTKKNDTTKLGFDPSKDNTEFDSIKMSLKFARPKQIQPHPETPYDSSNFEPDPDSPSYLLGEFKNVKVSEYYRAANHIRNVADSTSLLISQTLMKRPEFYIESEFSRTTAKKLQVFPLVITKFDVIIRFHLGY